MMDQKRMDAVVELARALIAQSSESGPGGRCWPPCCGNTWSRRVLTASSPTNMGNLLGRLAGSRPGKRVLLDGHH